MTEIEKAWLEVREYVLGRNSDERSTHSVSQRRHTIAVLLGYTEKQLSTWLKNEAVPKSTRAQRAILQHYRQTSKSIDPYWHLSRSVTALLYDNAEIRPSLEAYENQKFTAYRIGLDQRFHIGDFSVSSSDNSLPMMHHHSAEQAINGAVHSFSHSGPIFTKLNRIYCLAVGETYFRSMIFKMVENPLTMVTFGMLLTEHYEDDLPMASKVALVHKDHPEIDDDAFLDALETGLKTNSENCHILLGTKKMPSLSK